MMSRNLRTLALASFLTTGLVAGSGCNTENPDGTPNALGKAENKAKELETKAANEARVLEHKAEEGLKHAADATGKGLVKAGEKLQDAVKPADAPVPPPVETPKAPVETPKAPVEIPK